MVYEDLGIVKDIRTHNIKENLVWIKAIIVRTIKERTNTNKYNLENYKKALKEVNLKLKKYN